MMEIITHSPGFFHIAKKIVGLFGPDLETIKSLRLLSKSWKNIIETKQMSKLWQNLTRKNVYNKDVGNVLDFLYMKAYERHNGKLQWQLSHYVLTNFAKSYYPTPNICHLGKSYYKTFSHWKFNELEAFISTSPYGLVEDIFNEENDLVDLHKIDIRKLLVYSTFYCARDDIVKIIYDLFPIQFQGEQFAKEFIEPLAVTICETGKFPNLMNKYMKILSVLADPLRKLKYPQDVAYYVLQRIHYYAAIEGYFEIASIVAEKLGQKYVDLATIFMSNNTDRMNKDLFNLMASKIDQNDLEKIIDSKDTSLHKAAKEGNFKFIMNFAPYSSTVHEKDQTGRNTLFYVLKSFHLSSEELQEMAVETLMKLNVVQDNDEKLETKLEADSDFRLEDSENESVDLYESESECEL